MSFLALITVVALYFCVCFLPLYSKSQGAGTCQFHPWFQCQHQPCACHAGGLHQHLSDEQMGGTQRVQDRAGSVLHPMLFLWHSGGQKMNFWNPRNLSNLNCLKLHFRTNWGIRCHLIQASHFIIKEIGTQNGYRVFSKAHNQQWESELKSRALATALDKTHRLAHTGLPLSIRSGSSQSLFFLPIFKLPDLVLLTVVKVLISTLNLESLLNSFILLRVTKLLSCVWFNVFPWHSELSINQPVTKMYSIPPVSSEPIWVLQGRRERHRCPYDC